MEISYRVPRRASRGNRVMFSSSDDNAMLKQVLLTHTPDGREFNVRPVLQVVDGIFRRAKPTVPGAVPVRRNFICCLHFHSLASKLNIICHELHDLSVCVLYLQEGQLQLDTLDDRIIRDMLEYLSYTINKVACEVLLTRDQCCSMS